MTGGSVPHYLFAPDRESSLRAVARALLKVRALDSMTIPKVAEALGCSVDTIKDASNEQTLLTFDKVARLVFLFPVEAAPVVALMNHAPMALTAEEHSAAIERHTDALLRMAREGGE
jgi:hypothetical protein